MLLHLFKRSLILFLLAHCLSVARWYHFCNFVADASVVLVATNATYQDRIAAFGPRLTDKGLFGYLVSIETIEDDNQKGCNKLKKNFANDNCIALVERGQCSFIDKVRNMQASGAIAVVVGNNEHNGLITMYATGDTSDVKIPSVFVAQTEYRDLKSLLVVAKEPVEIQLLKDDLLQWPLLDVIIVVILSLTVLVIFIYVLWRIRQRQRRKRNLAPPQFVGDLPTKIFYRSKRQENEPQECVICLEDFVDEDELRIIPCFHEFHIKCIDSWLTTRHRFCPICKRDVTLPTTETPLLSVP